MTSCGLLLTCRNHFLVCLYQLVAISCFKSPGKRVLRDRYYFSSGLFSRSQIVFITTRCCRTAVQGKCHIEQTQWILKFEAVHKKLRTQGRKRTGRNTAAPSFKMNCHELAQHLPYDTKCNSLRLAMHSSPQLAKAFWSTCSAWSELKSLV